MVTQHSVPARLRGKVLLSADLPTACLGLTRRLAWRLGGAYSYQLQR